MNSTDTQSETVTNAPNDVKDIAKASAAGSVWVVAGQGVLAAIGFMVTPVLTRLLTPDDFGIVGMVAALIGISGLLIDGGLANAAIQADKLSRAQSSNLFWLSVLLGAVTSIAIALLAGTVSWFYEEPKVIPVIYISACGVFLSALQIQPVALLKRNLQFDRVVQVNIAKTVLGACTSILIAYLTDSYLALAWGPVVAAFAGLVLSLYAANWVPQLPQRNVGTKRLVNFGAQLTGFSFINYFARKGDDVLIAKFLGAAACGAYTKAYALMMLPLSQLNRPMTSLALPALSRLNNDPTRYRRAYVKLASRILLLTTPIAVVGMCYGHDITSIVFGPNWGSAGGVFAILSANCLFQPLYNSTGWLFTSQGRGKAMMYWGLCACPVIILSFVVGLPWGIQGVATSYTIIMLIQGFPLFWWVGREGPVATSDLFQIQKDVAIQAMFCFCAVIPIRSANVENVAIRIALAITASGIGSLIYLIISGRLAETLADVRTIQNAIFQRTGFEKTS